MVYLSIQAPSWWHQIKTNLWPLAPMLVITLDLLIFTLLFIPYICIVSCFLASDFSVWPSISSTVLIPWWPGLMWGLSDMTLPCHPQGICLPWLLLGSWLLKEAWGNSSHGLGLVIRKSLINQIVFLFII